MNTDMIQNMNSYMLSQQSSVPHGHTISTYMHVYPTECACAMCDCVRVHAYVYAYVCVGV